MKTQTCHIPNNINPLQTNGFMLSITKLPEMTYFCQEVDIPGINLPPAEISSPLSKIPFVGDKIEFTNLNVVFLINEDMSNYLAIHDWMLSLGFPKHHEQYRNFIEDNKNPILTTPAMAATSDGVLTILNSSNNVVRTVHFVDLVPISLSSLTLRSTSDDTSYLTGLISFDYNHYEFK